MQRIYFLILIILLLLMCFENSQTQPKIAYVIPDVGSPGLGVYVEFIGPVDAFNNFGEDSFYPNNNGRVRIVFDRAEDSSKIVVGPIFVSWLGRMLSAYFFVNPNLEEPNSSDWTLLDNKFRIPVRVEVDGNLSNADTFYIVKPYNFGNILQTNQVFGNGVLGRRSPSGALLVDSLNLSNLEYKVFLDNSITYPRPNRSYLPFIILATRNIVGQGVNSKLNVSAGDGRVQNAGPGGGGGGGRFCDNFSGNPGEDGGNGFTSGGKGGVNNLFGSGLYKNLGCGTGDSGKSLNGVLPAANPGGWEASGGGTGHPFGKSGIGSGDQSNWNYPGGYGGGTGSINNKMGGSGGYATDGQSEPSNYVNGGKTHGNSMIVPIAGGSGGASGNPSGLNVCAGSGGGGGGAIRIFAKRIENLSVLANGANGGQSSYGAGGGGSGGSVSICAKEASRNLTLSAQGGNGGGRGYFRIDAPSLSNITFSHNNPPAYIGVSTDTHSYVKRKFIIAGSKNASSDDVLIFIKSSNSDWTLIKTVSGFVNQNFWNTEIVLPDTSKIFYLCAIQDLGSPTVDTFRYQPRYLFSQAAMNVIYRVPQGICSGVRQLKINVYDCPGRVYIDSGVIKNVGDADLDVYFSRARFSFNSGIELISPKNDITLKPNDSVKFYVRFVAQGGAQPGVIYDSLLIEHSDNEWSPNPWSVLIRFEFFPYEFNIYALDNITLVDTVDFGLVCSVRDFDTTVLVANKSLFPIKFNYRCDNPGILLRSANLQTDSFNSDSLRITINNPEPGSNLDSIWVYPEDCPDLKKKIYLRYNLLDIQTQFEFNGKTIDTLNLGEICIGDTIAVSYYVKNTGNYSLSLVNFEESNSVDLAYFIPQNFSIIPQQKIENIITCTPKQEGLFTTLLIYQFDQCQHKDTLVVTYKSVKSYAVAVSVSYFGFVQVGTSDTSVVIIVNRGSGTSYYDTPPPSFPNFKFIESNPTLPTYLRPGDTLKLFYEFKPDQEGEFREIAKYISNSTKDCPDTINFELRGFGTNARIFANVDSVHLGLFPYCKSRDTVIYITNKGSVDLVIYKVEIQQSYVPEHFILSNSFSRNIIPPNSTDSCVVKFVGVKGAPSGLKTAELVIENSDIKNPQIRIKLTAVQENLSVKLLPDTLDFGICQIGDTKKRILKLINFGVYPEAQRIRDIEGNKAVFRPNPSVAVIQPRDSVEIEFTFSPDREGEIFDSMRIVYFQPCPDTQWVYLRGQGTAGSFSVKDTLDFGEIVICSSDTLKFNIVNLGTIPFTIDSARILGADLDNFFLLNTLPQTVDSIRSMSLVFAGAKNEREYKAILRIYIFINNATRQVDIVLKAKPKKFINFEIVELDFGFVPVGLRKDSTVRIRNYGFDCVLVDNFFSQSPSAFLTDLQKKLPIPKSFEPTFQISFTPYNEGAFEDTLRVLVQYPDCIDTISLLVKGFGVPPQDVIIRVANVQFDPKTQYGRIPIYIKLKDSTKVLSAKGLEFKLSFYWALFNVTGIDYGKIIKDRISNQIREITLSFGSIKIDGLERKLAEVNGVPLIADTDFTIVAIYDCVWDDPGFVRNTILDSGSISILVCTEGGKRLVKPTIVSNINASPNDDGILLEIKSEAKDNYRIKVYNLLGSLIYEWSDIVGVATKRIRIPSDVLQTGVVFIQISNSFETQVLKTIYYR
ncbi:MAG: hypothetical protein ACP5I9_09825 [Candidatus Kapaibacteriota bacterium]